MTEEETVDAIVAYLDRRAVVAAGKGCFGDAAEYQSIAEALKRGDWNSTAFLRDRDESNIAMALGGAKDGFQRYADCVNALASEADVSTVARRLKLADDVLEQADSCQYEAHLGKCVFMLVAEYRKDVADGK